MPHSDPEVRRAYMRSYKERHRARINSERRDSYVSRARNDGWTQGHSDFATCIACGGRTTSKPADCSEPRHHERFRKRAARNLAYQRFRAAEAKSGGRPFQKNKPATRNASSAKLRHRRRTLVLERLGDECARCGFADRRALHIDHIHGGGRKHRGEVGSRFLKSLVELSDADLLVHFQLLCANCNTIKAYENGER